MTTLRNEVTINAPMEKIWGLLTNVEELANFDPTVRAVKATSSVKNGNGAARKVDMLDGKNWFEEKCTVCETSENLVYELTNCSFPVHRLKHSYRFENMGGGKIKVKQVMEYQMKFGFLGKIIDVLMVRKQSDKGIKAFMAGLKSYSEK